MRVAVVGASGAVGAPLLELLRAGGHEVRALHRSSPTHPVDLSTGEGLVTALADVEVVVNAANQMPPRSPGPTLVAGTRRLIDAAPAPAHHVLISIVGIDRTAAHYGYYGAKLAQEQVVAYAGRPYTIVRATQFHEFLGGYLLRAARAGIALRSRALFQPIAAAEVAAVLAQRALAPPANRILSAAGPEELTLTELRAGPGVTVPLPIPGAFGRELRAGALCEQHPDVRGVLTYAQWLAHTAGRPWRAARST